VTSMPMHTSTITGVVQDIFLSLDDVVQAADRPPLRQHIAAAAGRQVDSYDDLISDRLKKRGRPSDAAARKLGIVGGRANRGAEQADGNILCGTAESS
jgi:hypothetical protein